MSGWIPVVDVGYDQGGYGYGQQQGGTGGGGGGGGGGAGYQFAGQQILNDPMANMAMTYGQNVADQGKDYINKNVRAAGLRYVSGYIYIYIYIYILYIVYNRNIV